MESFTLTEISITAVAVIGACGSFIAVLEKSRCKNISLCCGMYKCDRILPDETIDPDIEEGT
tara:strand:- start:4904 stop:5089 length:186 start_codon:yes stop_codon:yes gene_type:complete